MNWPEILGSGLGGLVLGAGLYFLYSKLVGADAKTKARSILENATRDADTKAKEADLRIRELGLNQKAAAAATGA